MIFKLFFGVLFFFAALLFILGFSVIRGILRFFFGNRKQTGQQKDQRQAYHREQQTRDTYTQPTEKKKLFEKDEGEYVDFEEIN